MITQNEDFFPLGGGNVYRISFVIQDNNGLNLILQFCNNSLHFPGPKLYCLHKIKLTQWDNLSYAFYAYIANILTLVKRNIPKTIIEVR